jgi:RNA polymerase sigma-70 factor (ECF subfamily)
VAIFPVEEELHPPRDGDLFARGESRTRIEGLPEDEREAFSLVRVQGMSQPDAAAVLGVSTKTIQRRLNRCRLLLAEQLADLQPMQRQHEPFAPESGT